MLYAKAMEICKEQKHVLKKEIHSKMVFGLHVGSGNWVRGLIMHIVGVATNNSTAEGLNSPNVCAY